MLKAVAGKKVVTLGKKTAIKNATATSTPILLLFVRQGKILGKPELQRQHEQGHGVDHAHHHRRREPGGQPSQSEKGREALQHSREDDRVEDVHDPSFLRLDQPVQQQRHQAGRAGDHSGSSPHRSGDHVDDPAGLEGRRGGQAGQKGVGNSFGDHAERDDDGAEELVGVGQKPDGGPAEDLVGTLGAGGEAAAAQVCVQVVDRAVLIVLVVVVAVVARCVALCIAVFLARSGRFDVAVVFDGFARVLVGVGVFERDFLVVVVAEDGHGDLGQIFVIGFHGEQG
ncbi:hypothetical protein ACHAXS_006890 [Conticribra weissflogii]